MKFNYFTDESEKTLAPFFSPPTMSAVFTGIMIVSGLLLLFWPRRDLASFIGQNKAPLVFFVIFTVTLIMHAYLNLRCGRGEMIKFKYFPGGRLNIVTFEKENSFLQYGLIGFLLHILFLLFPFLPLLILSTPISGLSLLTFARACSIIFTAALLCRMFGFIVYFWGGRLSSFGYLLTRVFIAVFLFVTILLAPAINPILVLYGLYDRSDSLQNIGVSAKGDYLLYMITVGLAIGIFTILSQILVKYHIHKESES